MLFFQFHIINLSLDLQIPASTIASIAELHGSSTVHMLLKRIILTLDIIQPKVCFSNKEKYKKTRVISISCELI